MLRNALLIYVLLGSCTMALDMYGLTLETVLASIAYPLFWPVRIAFAVRDYYRDYKERKH